MHNTVSKFIPESKELVLDIDITDYDDVRLCGCKEADICPKCWPLMSAAIEVTHKALTGELYSSRFPVLFLC
jgi:DNA primase small subunit